MRGNFEGIFIIDCLVESLPYNGCAARLHSFPLFLSFISLFLFLFERGVSKAFSEDKTLSANVRTPPLPLSLSLSLHSICHFVEEKGDIRRRQEKCTRDRSRRWTCPSFFLPHSCLAFLGNLGSHSPLVPPVMARAVCMRGGYFRRTE